MRENYAKLQMTTLHDFVALYEKMYEDHKDGVIYKLALDAQKDYDEMVDAFADFLDEKYEVRGR